MTVKELKRGEMFALRPIEKAEPLASQVFIRRKYDRSMRKYWCERYSDISDGKFLPGDKEIYQDFVF